MHCSPRFTHPRRTLLALVLAGLTASSSQFNFSTSQASTIPSRHGFTSAVVAGNRSVVADAQTQCPTLPAASAISGSTELNTVKAQMWIVNGVWWGAFASSGLYFYKRSGNAFIKGALIDSSGGRPDTLWNGTNLFILTYKSSSQATLRKYSYDAATQTFNQLQGSPVNLSLSGASAITFAQDTQGKLWAAYTGSSLARVIWSTSADHTIWNTAGFVLATGLPSSGEIAAIVAFGGNKVGVSWSNQGVGEDGFRYHDDGTTETSWSSKELIDCCKFSPGGVADDHMNIKAAPDGRIFLVAKDSNLNANGTGNGNLHLYVRTTAGVWAPGALVNPDPSAEPTRPSLLLDLENNEVYVIYVDSHIDQALFSHTSMDNPSFGPACLFIGVKANNITSTKQNLDSNTDLVAAGSINGQILSNVVDLLPSGTSRPTITSLMPASAPAGSPGFTLIVNGTGFVDGSKVQWKGSDRETRFNSSAELVAAISDSDIALPGSANITVLNPPESGGLSNTQTFTIEGAGPTPTPTPSPTATPSPTPSQTTFSPTADARVRSTSATTNYGSDSELRVRRSSSSSSYESYLKFNLSSLGPGAITSAKLRLYGRLDSGSNVPTSVYSVSNTSWSETGITWNNRPTAGTTALGVTTVTSTSAHFYEWDITSFIKAEKTAGRNLVSIVFKNPQTSSPYVVFNAREASSNRPQLVITISGALSFLAFPLESPTYIMPWADFQVLSSEFQVSSFEFQVSSLPKFRKARIA